MKRFPLYLMLGLAVWVAACSSDSLTGTEDPPGEAPPVNTFSAEVTGAVTASLRGTMSVESGDSYNGSFIELDSSYAGGKYVNISLQADNFADQIRFVQFGDGLAAEAYPIEFRPSLDGPPYSFAGFYYTDPQSNLSFRATSGTLTLDTFSDVVIEGSFTFTGEQEGQEVSVEGSFEASRTTF